MSSPQPWFHSLWREKPFSVQREFPGTPWDFRALLAAALLKNNGKVSYSPNYHENKVRPGVGVCRTKTSGKVRRDTMGTSARRKGRRGSESSYGSSSDGTSSDSTTPPRRRSTAEARRRTRKKEDKLTKRILEELKDTRDEILKELNDATRKQLKEITDETFKQFKELTDETRKQLKELTDETQQLKELSDETRKQLKELTDETQQLKELSDETRKQSKELTDETQQLKELTDETRKQLKELHITGLSRDDSSGLRSESNQAQPPRYRLEFTCEVNDEIEKDKIIETKPHGEMIGVALKDDQNQIVDTGPLASAKVKLVVVNGEFNQHGNRCNWSKNDFLRHIQRPRKGKSAMGDVNQAAESIVENCFFDLVSGVKIHGDAKILENSGNKRVRLAVMMVSPTEERVLEGLSNLFFVRGHDRPARESKLRHNTSKRQRQAPVGLGCVEGLMQNPSWSHLNQPREIIPPQVPGTTIMLCPTSEPSTSVEHQSSHPAMYSISTAQLPYSLQARGAQSELFSDLMGPNSAPHNYPTGNDCYPIANVPPQVPGTTTMLCSTSEPSTSVEHQSSHPAMYRISTAQLPYSLQVYTRGEQSELFSDLMGPKSAPHNYSIGNYCFPIANVPPQVPGTTTTSEPSTSVEHQTSHPAMYGISTAQLPYSLQGTQFNMDHNWNLLDQLMPLYWQPKFDNCSLTTLHLMTEGPGSLMFIPPKDVMQNRRKGGVLIEPLEPDDSDKRELLERGPHRKYLRFVNKVCEAYYIREQIEANDGNPLKVALFDENDRKITSGPLSSASVEVLVLHGDFNADGQDYWTSEDFISCVVCPRTGKSEAVLEGDHNLILAGGEACLGDAFFKVTSFHARTGRFIMGVMMATAQEERIQEGISEPFQVSERPWQGFQGKEAHKDLPPGMLSYSTEQKLLHQLRNLAYSMDGSSIPKVDVYKLDPWDLVDREWYFCPASYLTCSTRQTGAGFWKASGREKAIFSGAEMLGLRKTLVFYKRLPSGGSVETSWMMHEFSLDAKTDGSDISNTKGSSFTSSMRLHEWALCRIFRKGADFDGPLRDVPSLEKHFPSITGHDMLPTATANQLEKLPSNAGQSFQSTMQQPTQQPTVKQQPTQQRPTVQQQPPKQQRPTVQQQQPKQQRPTVQQQQQPALQQVVQQQPLLQLQQTVLQGPLFQHLQQTVRRRVLRQLQCVEPTVRQQLLLLLQLQPMVQRLQDELPHQLTRQLQQLLELQSVVQLELLQMQSRVHRSLFRLRCMEPPTTWRQLLQTVQAMVQPIVRPQQLRQQQQLQLQSIVQHLLQQEEQQELQLHQRLQLQSMAQNLQHQEQQPSVDPVVLRELLRLFSRTIRSRDFYLLLE
ncbi:hypothetical protein ACP4OV_002308 [Aristida adscensionis]